MMPIHCISMPSGEVLVGLAIRKSIEDFEERKKIREYVYIGQYTKFRYVSHQVAAKAQAGLRICADSPDIRCSHTLGMDVDEGSGQNLDL